VRRLATLAALAGAGLLLGAEPAAATNECRGLMICVSVHGPWVVVPAGPGIPRPDVEFQLSCPRGFIVGGLDAELSDRAIDVGFLATVGSPVTPGVATSRAAVFVASYVGGSARAPTFRPHIGCIPATGGGGGIPTAARAVFPPGRPTVRRIRTVRINPDRSRSVVRECAADERLVDGWHALAFFTEAPPSESLVRSVSAARTLRGGSVRVSVRGEATLGGVRAVVQVGAVCAGGAI
jgi:hypothetical protein